MSDRYHISLGDAYATSEVTRLACGSTISDDSRTHGRIWADPFWRAYARSIVYGEGYLFLDAVVTYRAGDDNVRWFISNTCNGCFRYALDVILEEEGGNPAEDLEQFFTDILTTAEVGYWAVTLEVGYWAVTLERDRRSMLLQEWEDGEPVRDPKCRPHRVDQHVLARGIYRALKPETKINPTVQSDIRAAYYGMDAGELDATDADVIVQLGLFGEIRFG